VSAVDTGVVIGVLLIFALALWFAGTCLRDLATTPDSQLRIFPKMTWALLIIITIPLGGLFYLRYGKGPTRFP
jgi:hypothetical protein